MQNKITGIQIFQDRVVVSFNQERSFYKRSDEGEGFKFLNSQISGR